MIMKKTIVTRILPIIASLPLLAGCVVYERPAPVVAEPPPAPAPQVEVIAPAPGPVAVWFWAPGEWVWRGNWVWVGGHWAARPHPGAVWVRGGWGWHGRGRVWVGAHWR